MPRLTPQRWRKLVKAFGLLGYSVSRQEGSHIVLVMHAGRDAKFWPEPAIEIADNHGLSPRHLARARRLIGEHQDEIRRARQERFGS